MSPGPAFVFTISRAVRYGRTKGILASVGLGLGILAQVTLALTGVSFLISQSDVFMNIVKYAGAAYLLYLGVKSIRARKRPAPDLSVDVKKGEAEVHPLAAVFQGFLTNALNPKAFVFFTAVFAQFITPETPLWIHFLYGGTCVVFETLWFSGVVVFLTNSAINRRFMGIVHWIERVCGGMLIGLGLRLALVK